MEADDILIVCSDENNLLNHLDVQCRDCQKDVTLSDSTIQSIKLQHPDIDLVACPPTLVCLECFFKSYYDPDKIQPLSQTQADDILSLRK